MPQMAPLSWLSLFFMFSFVFMLFILINYFVFVHEPKKSFFKSTETKVNWKW